MDDEEQIKVNFSY